MQRVWVMHRKAVALIAAGALALGLSACSTTPVAEYKSDDQIMEENGGDLYVATKELPDGRTVTCLIYISVRKGGLSCDWENALEGEPR